MHPHTEELTFHKSSYSQPTQNCVEVAPFRKSSYSGGRTDNCVEVAPFRKSSYSGSTTQNCVEVADLSTGAAVRDTQNRSLGALSFPSSEWAALLSTTQRDL